MRRLFALLLLLAALPASPSVATSEAPAAPAAPGALPAQHELGRLPVGDVPESERLRTTYRSLAVTPESREIVQALEPAFAKAAAGQGDEIRMALGLTGPDMDGDRVGDVLLYDTTVWIQDHHFQGDTTLAVFSGRTGRQVWRRTFEDTPAPPVYWAKVGDRRQGLVMAAPVGESYADYGYRFVGIGGRGDIVYDRRVVANDSRGGHVQFGGLFNAFTGGGDDILVGRVERVVGVDVGFGLVGGGPTYPPQVDFTQAYVLDGRDGSLDPVSPREMTVGGAPRFAAVGDLDRDKRDDYVLFRRGLREGGGSASARSVVENKVLWTNTATPVGTTVFLPRPQGDHLGDRRGDLLYETWLDGSPLLRVKGVTDEMPLFHGEVPGTHLVILDGKDGSLGRRIADGAYTAYTPYRDVDRDGKLDLVAVTWTTAVRQAGLTLAMLTDAGGTTRWTRELFVDSDVPGLASNGFGTLENAGDVDLDGFDDWAYRVEMGLTSVTKRSTAGFLFPRTGRTVATTDLPLGGTVDGRGTDRYGYDFTRDTALVSMREGRTGASYWSVRATSATLAVVPRPLTGQRRACDGVVLIGVPRVRSAAGQVWAVALDGGTGRVRWSRALTSGARPLAVSAPSGPPARCA